MTLPGTPSLAYLAILLVGLPWASLRSGKRLRAARASAPGAAAPSRRRIWASTLFVQALLLYLAWRVGSGFGFALFTVPRLGLREILIAVATLGVCLGLRLMYRASLSDVRRRELMVYYLAPRTRGEEALWLAAVLLASIAEEAAYRGVGFSILWYTVGDPWLAAGVSAVAFALVHTVQGWRSVILIVVFGLVLQGLVVLTDTLVLAMVVHAAYDLIAGHLIVVEAKRRDASG